MKSLVKRILTDVERKHLPLVAAGVAYYFLVSLIPGLMLLAAAIAYLPWGNAMEGTTAFMAHVIPRQGMIFVEELLATITPHRMGLLSFGAIATVWLTSKAFKGVISGLDIVYEVRVPRRLWITRILAFGLTFAVGALLLLGVFLTLAGPPLGSLLSTAVPAQSLWLRVWPFIQWSLSAIFTFGAIELLYILAPNAPLENRLTVPGAVIATAILLALSWGIGYYFHHFGEMKLDNVYGALATPFALLIWMYWSAGVILIGAEFNVSFQRRKNLEFSKPENTVEHEKDAA